MTNQWKGSFANGSFFGANPNNANGLKLEFITIESENGTRIRAETTVEERFEGPPGHVHGGITSAILDEAMGNVCFRNGYICVSATQTTDWHRPTPLNTKLILEAWVSKVEGKKVFPQSKLMFEDGTVLVSAHGVYINRRDLFKKFAAELAKENG